MATPNFPPNSKQPPQKPKEERRLEPVAQGSHKKPSLGKQFSKTFMGGDLKTTAHYVVFDVAIPSFRDLVADSAVQGIERLIFGESRGPRRRGMSPMRPGPPGPLPGRVNYTGYSQAAPVPSTPGSPLQSRQRAQPSQQVGDFEDILLGSRTMAEVVLERMGDVLSAHGRVYVADLYALCDLPSNHTDNNWGWTDLRGSSVVKNRGGGYLLNLPDPEAF